MKKKKLEIPKIEIPENLSDLPKKLPKLTILGEFKKFALRGNVIDLAVGVIIGGAFQKIVSSAVGDLLMPIVGLFTGNVNFNDRSFTLRLPYDPNKEAVINYGSFITSVIDFIIMAFVVFLLVKVINRLSDLTKKPEDETKKTKICPYCCSEIPVKAVRCPHCTSKLSAEGEEKTSSEEHKKS